MALRASTGAHDDEALQVVMSGVPTGLDVEHQRELLSFVDVTHSTHDASILQAARSDLSTAIGWAGVVDAAAIVAAFEGFTRMADATGCHHDAEREAETRGLRERLGIERWSDSSRQQ